MGGIMNPNVALVVIAGLIAVSVLLGIVVRATQTRIRPATAKAQNARAERVDPASLVADHQLEPTLGRKLTLLQFSTEFCTRCPATSRTLTAAARGYDGVEHLDID